MALATGFLGDRLRQAGTALGVVESELRQLRLEASDILDAIDTGVVTVDADGRIAYLNRAAGTLLALDDEPAEGWNGREILDELDRRAPGLGSQLRHTLQTERPVRWYETRTIGWGEGPGGTSERMIGARTTVLEREDGGAPWVTVVFQDITDGKRLEELNRRAARLQAVAELAASLAHEIRNPLASIRSAVEQLVGDGFEPRDQSVLRHLVQTESDRLSRLLSEFIEFSRVRLRERATVDLAALAADATEVARRHPAGNAEIHIDFHAPDGPVEIEGDADLLHRLAFNLVLNAVQNAGPGGNVRVRGRPGRRGQTTRRRALRLAGPPDRQRLGARRAC